MKSKIRSVLLLLGLVALAGCAASPFLAQTPPQNQNPALGIVVKSTNGHVGSAPVPDGASIFSGDALSTQDNGTLSVRLGPLSLQLEPSSEAHIYRAPYGAVVELNRGTVIYTTPGTQQNLVIVASDVRVTPDLAAPYVGRVTIENRCEVMVYSQRGQAEVQTGSESRTVEQGKAYRVRAMNEVSYRQYVSPEADDYHNYHQHVPCALLERAGYHGPIAAGHSHFLLVTTALIGGATAIGVWKALESPDRP